MEYNVLISFVWASILLTIMPGPDIIYVLAQSISNGKKYGIATSLGLVSGITFHTTLVAFGVSAILKESTTLFFVIKLLGALYLFFLAYRSFVSKKEINLSDKVEKKGLLKLFKQGLIMNVLNPKVSIFFLAFFPGFLFSTSLNATIQFYVLGTIFIIQALVIFSLVAILSGNFSMFLKSHPNFNTNIKWFKIIVFVGIAIFILFS